MEEKKIEYCTCSDWQECVCGLEPPHCMWCCKDLTEEQLAILAKENGDQK